jgi:hypothetical protein
MRIIFIAYREWAIKVYSYVKNHPKVTEAVFCSNLDELYKIDVLNYDLLITVGLSQKIGNNIYEKIETIGLHCAELDRYSYGTPIQLQIIDGLLKTKHRVFRLRSGGNSERSHAHTREYANEVDLYLHGGIDEPTLLYHLLTPLLIIILTLNGGNGQKKALLENPESLKIVSLLFKN